MNFVLFEKAFVNVPHKRLMWKLELIGELRGSILQWTRDFLRDQLVRTVIIQHARWRDVTNRVPHGIVLAPVMVLIYFNDMVEGTSSHVRLFADD